MSTQTTSLVTGAGGFLGSHTVERLLADGCRVRAVDLDMKLMLELMINNPFHQSGPATDTAISARPTLMETFQIYAVPATKAIKRHLAPVYKLFWL